MCPYGNFCAVIHQWVSLVTLSTGKIIELLNMIRWNIIWKWILSLQTQWTLSKQQMRPETEMQFWSHFEKSPSIGRDDLKWNIVPWMRVTLPIWGALSNLEGLPCLRGLIQNEGNGSKRRWSSDLIFSLPCLIPHWQVLQTPTSDCVAVYHVSYPTDSSTATKLGLCSSLACLISHWQSYNHQARTV